MGKQFKLNIGNIETKDIVSLYSSLYPNKKYFLMESEDDIYMALSEYGFRFNKNTKVLMEYDAQQGFSKFDGKASQISHGLDSNQKSIFGKVYSKVKSITWAILKTGGIVVAISSLGFFIYKVQQDLKAGKPFNEAIKSATEQFKSKVNTYITSIKEKMAKRGESTENTKVDNISNEVNTIDNDIASAPQSTATNVPEAIDTNDITTEVNEAKVEQAKPQNNENLLDRGPKTGTLTDTKLNADISSLKIKDEDPRVKELKSEVSKLSADKQSQAIRLQSKIENIQQEKEQISSVLHKVNTQSREQQKELDNIAKREAALQADIKRRQEALAAAKRAEEESKQKQLDEAAQKAAREAAQAQEAELRKITEEEARIQKAKEAALNRQKQLEQEKAKRYQEKILKENEQKKLAEQAKPLGERIYNLFKGSILDPNKDRREQANINRPASPKPIGTTRKLQPQDTTLQK